jgi:hypothetical protein
MPTYKDPVPQGFLPVRLHAVTVHANWTKFFTVPEFEIGVLKSGWRGAKIEVQTTNDVAHIEDNPDTIFRRLSARYGEEVVRRYHAGPERLGEDMHRYAESTREWMAKAVANDEAEERKRIAAERKAREQQNAEQKKAG